MRGKTDGIIKRVVIIEGLTLDKKRIETLKEVEEKYKEILQQVIHFDIKNKITSYARLKGNAYYELEKNTRTYYHTTYIA